MHVHLELCVIPIGSGTSLGEYIAACQEELEAAGLATELHAYGTNVEGEWDTVFAAVKRCHERLHAKGAPRLFTSIKVGTRTDRQQSLDDKVASVRQQRSGG
ncbi:MTH1187 family thiamine-binding protein [Aquisalimonas sp. 2447]|uniref:MTH1187 family thiamine-binding protein n=1 Tax=Aquisalimonas sp. 2447 TaxID=2740807 RepID=UPI0014324D67|nr:MTH1187 family thiamine-binding protein [Aquisalimonas sp. 2447]QIT54329.1 MTH1187 family thiamine-binding protein [Aquisalimonas sp. 2447]